ncbi:MAG: 2-C-methyl-D-erythritol 4-phosphate cytidylyltransferase [Clostridia bacterium]|nr:2-C-methyl-D-erythritol 4-phosphate cytidylyltransferase [Clostridia bacterium]
MALSLQKIKKELLSGDDPTAGLPVSAVIVAAGRGSRMGGVSKPEIKIGGKTLFNWVLDAFLQTEVCEIVVVCGENRTNLEKLVPNDPPVPIRFCSGGKIRSESVYNGVSATRKDSLFVCVHDCARPFVTQEIVHSVLEDARQTGAATACCPVTDTIKYVDPVHQSVFTPNRDCLTAVQTPQIFRKDWYKIAYAQALKESRTNGGLFTDETSMLEKAGFSVAYTECPSSNLKLTTKEDILTARAILLLKQRELEKEREKEQKKESDS